MKYFITLAVICLIAETFAQQQNIQLSEVLKTKAKNQFDVCIKQENVSEEDATNLLNNQLSNPSQATKCFGACFGEKIGTLKNGVLQEDVVLQKLGPIFGEEKVKAKITKCKNVQGSDVCDTVYELIKCYLGP